MHLRDLSAELLRRGHTVHVLVGGEGPFLQEMRERGIPAQSLRHLVRDIHPYHDAVAFWEIRRALKLLEPDLVAAHTSKAGWLSRAAAWSMGLPVVYTAHGWSFIQTASPVLKRFFILAEKLAGLLSSKVIVVSGHDRDFCIDNGMLPSHKVITVHNGIPDVPFRPTGQETGTPRLIMVARLERPKNHLILLKALSFQRDRDWQLDLVGDGPLLPQIRQWICRFQLADRVRLLGARRDVPELLSNAQCFVLTSNMEGFPISILEALRAGLPVVATDVGGVAEAVEDGINGYLIRKDNVEQLAAVLRKLISEPELRRKMGAASRQKYERHFRLDRMVDDTLAVYREISRLAEGDPASPKG